VPAVFCGIVDERAQVHTVRDYVHTYRRLYPGRPMSYLGGIGEIMLFAVGVTLGIVVLRLDD